MKRTVFLFCLIASSINAMAADLELTISGIRNKQGMIRFGVYINDQGFQEDKPFKTYAYSKEHISDGTMVINIKLKPGTYGIAILDDENNNVAMDYRFLGIPKEGFGFSVITGRIFKRPHFRDFCFYMPEDTLKMHVKLRYTL